MIAAIVDLIVVLILGVLAIHALGVWARSPAAPRSPKYPAAGNLPRQHIPGQFRPITSKRI
ncbi:hypothetical protein PCA10_28960 [Metapseudomonas resinovorans NBRC 106553]|uniref:Uncharacterized protein n=1 Tax=Metapseudomonas resinovorans NBRC 106553 TaxID=1245471 RepID=S6AVV0_METRE|nr:hypothetical protein PCA10_28720 [Pseudomonas resinovorans NBRC 106553]BAN48616.1 hypothetical protein PCA10_28840 [Pseudomonas resinovorans NBRC 106553]BAN48628.1 hypothetical protein PCA10_28960 [Pseudomonas resinovorans NBRC 106553]